MDKHGNIYVNENWKGFHSQLSGGKPIAGGGQITVKNGMIKKIDEQTGHHAGRQPEGRVYMVGRELVNQNIDLSKTRTMTWTEAIIDYY